MDLRTVVVLFHADKLLLLRRAPWKKLYPNRWTGLGGKVELNEPGDLLGSARRELFEETDLRSDEVSDLRLRRVVLMNKPGEGLLCLAFVTGKARTSRVPACNEGTLHWVAPDDLASLDLIENAAAVLPFLIEDVRRDARGPVCGVAEYDSHGQLVSLRFAE